MSRDGACWAGGARFSQKVHLLQKTISCTYQNIEEKCPEGLPQTHKQQKTMQAVDETQWTADAITVSKTIKPSYMDISQGSDVYFYRCKVF